MGDDATFALTVKADGTATLPKWAVLTAVFYNDRGTSDAGPVVNIHVDDIDAN